MLQTQVESLILKSFLATRLVSREKMDIREYKNFLGQVYAFTQPGDKMFFNTKFKWAYSDIFKILYGT